MNKDNLIKFVSVTDYIKNKKDNYISTYELRENKKILLKLNYERNKKTKKPSLIVPLAYYASNNGGTDSTIYYVYDKKEMFDFIILLNLIFIKKKILDITF